MTKKFTPIKKNDLVKEFKNVLLNGDIIRYDGYHTCIEVLPRSLMGKVASSDNLFQHTGSLYSYYKDNTINHLEYTLYLTTKISMSRSIDNVNLCSVIINGSVLR